MNRIRGPFREVLLALGIIALYLVLMIVVLPRFGFET